MISHVNFGSQDCKAFMWWNFLTTLKNVMQCSQAADQILYARVNGSVGTRSGLGPDLADVVTIWQHHCTTGSNAEKLH